MYFLEKKSKKSVMDAWIGIILGYCQVKLLPMTCFTDYKKPHKLAKCYIMCFKFKCTASFAIAKYHLQLHK
jgi:hypothetical protein